MPFERITIINIDPPAERDINSELQWLGAALGLFGERDKDSSCFRIFVTLVKANRQGHAISSDSIADSCELSRGTVVHHLNRLRDAGLVTPATEGYRLRAENMQRVMQDLEEDLQRLLQITRAVAEDIDRRLLR